MHSSIQVYNLCGDSLGKVQVNLPSEISLSFFRHLCGCFFCFVCLFCSCLTDSCCVVLSFVSFVLLSFHMSKYYFVCMFISADIWRVRLKIYGLYHLHCISVTLTCKFKVEWSPLPLQGAFFFLFIYVYVYSQISERTNGKLRRGRGIQRKRRICIFKHMQTYNKNWGFEQVYFSTLYSLYLLL